MKNHSEAQKFNFFCAGGVEQLSIRNAEDLAAVEALDPKLWLAISMPTADICFDARTLSLIDSDNDGRIRVPEIKAAVAFVRENFSDFSSFFAGETAFPLTALKSESPLFPTAQKLLDDAGNTDGKISAEAVQSAFSSFDAHPFNGDGLLSLASANGNADIENLLKDLFAVFGDEAAAGISPAHAEAFVAQAKAAIAWHEIGESDAKNILPIGEKTAEAFAAIEAVRVKAEDFFARSRLASYDGSATESLNPSCSAIAQLAQSEITSDASKAFPLAHIRSEKGVPVLPLADGVNPAWLSELTDLRDKALVPALNLSEKPASITETQWRELLAKFAAYATWIARKPTGNILTFSVERLREIVAQNPVETLAPLFERDNAEAPLRSALENLERLCLYSGNLLSLLRNYVSFADFYTLSPETTFIAGKLYIDSRECSLCICVKDANAHAALAGKSNCFIAYCKCTRPSDGKAITIAAVLGDGDSDFLAVGRNGVFVDKDGNDWDATVIKIVEQPISLRQAVWAPYRKLARFVETQINNFAAAREKKVDQSLSSGVENVAGTATAPATGTVAKPAFDLGKFVGIFAAIGLALGALGAALATIASAFMDLAWWQMPLVILGILLLISVPSVIITAMKLRRRTLGPILDANSWAINARAKINISLGKAYTKMPQKPSGSKRIGKDLYAEKSGISRKIVFTVLLLAIAATGGFLWHKYNCDTAKKADAGTDIPVAEKKVEPATPAEATPVAAPQTK